MSLLIGLSSAVETLGSQHNGARNYKEVGIVLQRSCVVLGVLAIPVGFLWYYSGDIFQLLGIEEEVREVIQSFLRVRMITIPVDVINESYEKYLMSIGVVHPSMYANIAFNLIILTLDFLFVNYYHFDYVCLAWSWVAAVYISASIQIILSLRYVEVSPSNQLE